MGGSNSKANATAEDSKKGTSKSKGGNFLTNIKSNVEDELARGMMLQREVGMAVNIARARDTIWIFGSAWATLVVGAGTAKAMGRNVPPIVGAPVVIGALVLGNMADMAYGNKLNRAVKEAEYILEFERSRLVPFHQASFHKFYADKEKSEYYEHSTAVGDLFPNNMFARPSSSKEEKK
jgi:hypothetical protein